MNSCMSSDLFELWIISSVQPNEFSTLVRGWGQVIDDLGIFADMILVPGDGFCMALSISVSI